MNLKHSEIETRPFLLFSIAVALALIFPWLLQDGMFMDGLLYADVAKNYADGNGSFWHLRTDEVIPTEFHHQPPLVFFLESGFFKMMPDSIFPERIYCLLMFFITLWLIRLVWRTLIQNPKLQGIDYLPVLFYFICPTVFWSYINNVIEITMVNFVLGAALLLGKVYEERWQRTWLLMAGIFVVLAFLCKGIQGIFLISFPLFQWVVFRRITFRRAVADTIILLLPLILFNCTALSFETVRSAYFAYFEDRFPTTFSGINDTVPTRLYLLWDLVQVFIPMFILLVVLYFAGHSQKDGYQTGRNAVFLFCIGFGGILPLMVTREQRVFYSVTAFPYVMMAFSLLVAPGAMRLVEITTPQIRKVITLVSVAAILITFIVGISIAGTPKRDADLLHDVYAIGAVTGKSSVLGCDFALYSDWSVPCYLSRYFHIALDFHEQRTSRDWYIVRKGRELPPGFHPVDIGSGFLLLGKRMKN
jgi:4-amino-4-deoxy-L-arabinose transferase-like glycosyltransferase